jgi:hypothetical protein
MAVYFAAILAPVANPTHCPNCQSEITANYGGSTCPNCGVRLPSRSRTSLTPLSVSIPRPPSDRPPALVNEDRWDVSDDPPASDLGSANTQAAAPSPSATTSAPLVVPSSVGTIKQAKSSDPLRATIALSPAQPLTKSNPPEQPAVKAVVSATAPSSEPSKTLVHGAAPATAKNQETLLQGAAKMSSTLVSHPAVQAPTAPSSVGVSGASKPVNPLTTTLMIASDKLLPDAPKPSGAGQSQRPPESRTATLLHTPAVTAPAAHAPVAAAVSAKPASKIGAQTLVQHAPFASPSAAAIGVEPTVAAAKPNVSPSSVGSIGNVSAPSHSLRATLVGGMDAGAILQTPPVKSQELIATRDALETDDETRPFSAADLAKQTASTTTSDPSARTLLHSSPAPAMDNPVDAAALHKHEELPPVTNRVTRGAGSAPSDDYEQALHTDAPVLAPPMDAAPRALAATMLAPQAAVDRVSQDSPPAQKPPNLSSGPAHKASAASANDAPRAERSKHRSRSTRTEVIEPAHRSLRILLVLSGVTLLACAIPTAIHAPSAAATAAIPGLTALLMGLLPMGYATRALLSFAPALPAIAVYAMGNASHALAPALMLTALCALWPGALLFRGYFARSTSGRALLSVALLLGVGWSVSEGGGGAFQTPVGTHWLVAHIPVAALIPLMGWSFVLLLKRFSATVCAVSALGAMLWAVLPFLSAHPITAIALSALSAITGASIATLLATYTPASELSASSSNS